MAFLSQFDCTNLIFYFKIPKLSGGRWDQGQFDYFNNPLEMTIFWISEVPS